MKSIKRRRTNNGVQLKTLVLLIYFFVGSLEQNMWAQEVVSKAELKVTVDMKDSVKTATALLTLNGQPVNEKAISFFVKRLYSLHPIGESATTDEDGIATIDIPMDIPADLEGNLAVIANIVDDENVGTVEGSTIVAWPMKSEKTGHWGERSLSASRDKAPFYLILVSNVIICIIWGTILYVLLQLFKIKKYSKLNFNKSKK
jgi:hypothetical protein